MNTSTHNTSTPWQNTMINQHINNLKHNQHNVNTSTQSSPQSSQQLHASTTHQHINNEHNPTHQPTAYRSRQHNTNTSTQHATYHISRHHHTVSTVKTHQRITPTTNQRNATTTAHSTAMKFSLLWNFSEIPFLLFDRIINCFVWRQKELHQQLQWKNSWNSLKWIQLMLLRFGNFLTWNKHVFLVILMKYR